MGAKTGIEWTDATWNPIGGCSIKSPGCIHCYAQRLCGLRLAQHPLYAGTTSPSKNGPMFNGHLTVAKDDAKVWQFPLSWRGAKLPVRGVGRGSLIFVGDMSDLFHENRPNEVIDRVIAAAMMSKHTLQILTKRPDRMREYFAAMHDAYNSDGPAFMKRWGQAAVQITNSPCADMLIEEIGIPQDLWLGCSVESQPYADERREAMRGVAAMGFTTFVSYEPAIGPVQWGGWHFLRWLISGGESGPDARPSHPEWHRIARDWCARNNTAYFFKQWGEWAPGYVGEVRNCSTDRIRLSMDGERSDVDDDIGGTVMSRIGKNKAGALLDGRAHREFPT